MSFCCGLDGKYLESSPQVASNDKNNLAASSNKPKPSENHIIGFGNSLLSVSSEDTAGDDIDLSSTEAKKAASVFDSLDTKKSGTLPESAMEDLLDELGEGLHGDEFDSQKALIDPESTGILHRSAFVRWYVDFVTTGERDDNAALDSVEKEEST